MVIAALIKEFQLGSELNQMKGIVPDDILEALKKKKLGLPGIDTEAPPERNAMIMGEFEVILELIAKHPEAKIAKAQVIICIRPTRPVAANPQLAHAHSPPNCARKCCRFTSFLFLFCRLTS